MYWNKLVSQDLSVYMSVVARLSSQNAGELILNSGQSLANKIIYFVQLIIITVLI